MSKQDWSYREAWVRRCAEGTAAVELVKTEGRRQFEAVWAVYVYLYPDKQHPLLKAGTEAKRAADPLSQHGCMVFWDLHTAWKYGWDFMHEWDEPDNSAGPEPWRFAETLVAELDAIYAAGSVEAWQAEREVTE